MKPLSILVLLIGGVLAPFAHLHSQSAQPMTAPTRPAQMITVNIVEQIKAPIAQLQAIKVANQAALDKQAKTLQALDELQKQADELKIYGKRS